MSTLPYESHHKHPVKSRHNKRRQIESAPTKKRNHQKYHIVPIDLFIDAELKKLENSTDYHSQRLYLILEQYRANLPRERRNKVWKFCRNTVHFLYGNFLVAPCIPLAWRGIWNLFDRVFPKDDWNSVIICIFVGWAGLIILQILVWLTNMILLDVPSRVRPQDSMAEQHRKYWASRRERLRRLVRFAFAHVVHQIIYYIGLVVGVITWKGIWDIASFQVLHGSMWHQDLLTHIIPVIVLCLFGHLGDGAGPAPFFSSDEKGRLRMMIEPDLAKEALDHLTDVIAPNATIADEESFVGINSPPQHRKGADQSSDESYGMDSSPQQTKVVSFPSPPSSEALLPSSIKKVLSHPRRPRKHSHGRRRSSSSSQKPDNPPWDGVSQLSPIQHFENGFHSSDASAAGGDGCNSRLHNSPPSTVATPTVPCPPTDPEEEMRRIPVGSEFLSGSSSRRSTAENEPELAVQKDK